jgi:hypothetical protein
MASPIKYEIDADPWTIINRTATIYNRNSETYTISTWKSDFESRDNSWRPYFINNWGSEYTWQELSGWINIDLDSFEIWPQEEKTINFSINVPENATPGWHYWAVYFINNNIEEPSWAQISVNFDYRVLVLVNVKWEVTKDATVWNTIITNYNQLILKQKDKCMFDIDLSWNDYDGKCIDLSINNFKTSILDAKVDVNFEENIDNMDEDFKIGFEIPIENKWNTHIKPDWNIVIIDEDWNILKWIWKEIIKNKDWIIIWEKIVDYLPLNDVGGNILPYTKRDFDLEWKGFPYKTYDDIWNQVIKFWTPYEYYSKQNIENKKFLMPWEMQKEKISEKNLSAVLNVNYTDINWEEINFNSAKDFLVTYKEKYIAINPYFMILLTLLIILIIIILIIKRKVWYKCVHCKKKINKKMKLCPYCWKKQIVLWKKSITSNKKVLVKDKKKKS